MPGCVVLVDTMIVIEAVRTQTWNAISGQRTVATAEECRAELLRGDPGVSGYVPVTSDQISRAVVEPVSLKLAARFRLGYPGSDALDPGERDLLALTLEQEDDFELCCADKAAMRVAHGMGLLGKIISLEELADSVGAKPTPHLKTQKTRVRNQQWRTEILLG